MHAVGGLFVRFQNRVDLGKGVSSYGLSAFLAWSSDVAEVTRDLVEVISSASNLERALAREFKGRVSIVAGDNRGDGS